MNKLFTILFSFFSLIVISQPDSIPYSRDYEFKEGVFFTPKQFKQNNPILKLSISSGIPSNQLDFLTQVVEQKIITFKDASGNEQKLETASIWGYCQNRSFYINFNNVFNRFNVIGTFCHFTAIVSTSVGFRDPMGYGLNNSVDEMRQFVFDTQTNKVYDFNVKNMELLLKNDSDLYIQFMALKKRKKADSIFIYLRKYNEKHPLYLPEK